MSRPAVLRALQAARAAPAADELAAPVTTAPPPSPPVDAAPPGPSAGSTSSPAPAPPASTLPRPGATAGTLTNAAASSTTTSVTVAAEPRATSTTTTTAKKNPTTSTTRQPTTTTTAKKETATTAPPKDASRAREQSISSRGGVVTVRWSDGKVKFVVAHPKAGYEMKVWDNGPDRVVVSFYKDGRASCVMASSKDGSPTSEVVECAPSWSHVCRCGHRPGHGAGRRRADRGAPGADPVPQRPVLRARRARDLRRRVRRARPAAPGAGGRAPRAGHGGLADPAARRRGD